jgi:hypothetical protein
MLYWNELQPFHVADIIELAGRVDPTALQRAAEEELLASGIANPHLDQASGICTLRPGPCSVEASALVHTPDSPAAAVLEQHATFELRRPFQINVDPLIRLWVLHEGDHSFVGMTWQHWIADGMAAGDLFHRILARLHGWPVNPQATLRDLPPPDIATAFAPWFTWRHKLRHCWEVARTMATNFAVTKLPRPTGTMPATRIHFLDLPEDTLDRVRRVGQSAHATVNDVLVAVTARTLAEAVPNLVRSGWRRRLRIGNIVDLRPCGVEAVRGKCGVFLGLTNVDCTDPLPPWERLLDQVRRQTSRSKRGRTYLASLGGFRMSRRLWPWIPAGWRRGVNTNMLRLTAVLTNLRYPDSWYTNGAVRACWRALPMGMMYPLVFGITTLGQRLTITMSCDEVGPVAERAAGIKSCMHDGLRRL